jgi:two-component system response regulator
MTTVQVDAITILLVEDDEEDILLTRRALKKANLWNTVQVARNGQEALDYLYHQDKFSSQNEYPAPGLILLDLSLPGIDGREVLEKISSDPERRQIPVVIVSTSDYEKDIDFGRAHGVKNYVIKPIRPDNIIEAIGGMEQFSIILGNVKNH